MKTKILSLNAPFAVVALATICFASSAFADLVVNGGFETGDFTGWTTSPAPSGSNFGVDNTTPHSGTFAAFFSGAGANGTNRDIISQTFVTPPGTTFDLTFWLAGTVQDTESGFLNAFRVTWGSSLLVNRLDPGNPFTANFGYTQFTFTGLTPDPFSPGTTTLSFSSYNRGGAFHLDDVSLNLVTPNGAGVPDAGSTFLLLGLGFAALPLIGGTRLRRKA